MSEHTPEPWEVAIEREDGSAWPKGIRTVHSDENSLHEWIVRDGWDDDYGNDQFANARRIVAAVNACVGISTERLESANEGALALAFNMGVPDYAELTALRAQRDELAAALRDIRTTAVKRQGEPEARVWHGTLTYVANAATHALAKLTEEETR